MMLERGSRIVIAPGAPIGFQRYVTRAPSYAARGLVLGQFGNSSLLVVIVESRGRALVDAKHVSEVDAEDLTKVPMTTSTPAATVDPLGEAANH